MKAAVHHELGNPLVIKEVNLRDPGEKGGVGQVLRYHICIL